MIAYAGMFESGQQAQAAIQKLQERGFRADEVLLMAPASGQDLEVLLKTARSGEFITSDNTRAVSKVLSEGRWVVTVKAPLGRGRAATDALEGSGALPSTDLAPASVTSRPPRLFSEVIGMPLLTSGKSSTTLLTGKSNTTLMSGKSNTTLMSGKSMTTLIDKPAPFSSSFGLPVLSTPNRPWNTSFGFPLLSNNPAPLSRAFGLPILTKR